MRQYNRGLAVEGVLHTPYGPGSHPGSPQYALVAETFSDVVHSRIEVQGFLGILKEVNLVISRNQVAEPYPDKSNEEPPVVEGVEQFQNPGD